MVSREFDDYEVPRRNETDCENTASSLRSLLGIGAGCLPPILQVLELVFRL